MKKRLLIIALLCLAPLFICEGRPKSKTRIKSKRDKMEDVYDFTTPFCNEDFCNKYGVVYVNGDLGPTGRVSMFPVKAADEDDPESDPLKEKKADGSPVIPPEPLCPTYYCAIGYVGGEDTRAFHLEGIFPIVRGKWHRIVFEFIPRRDGKVKFSMDHWKHWRYQGQDDDDLDDATAIMDRRIKYKYMDVRYVKYAKFWTENTTLRDPNTTKPKAWCAYPGANMLVPGPDGPRITYAFVNKIKPTIVTEPEDAPVKKSLRTSNDICQFIPVKANQKVIVSFYVCGDDYFLAKWVDWDPDEEKNKAEKNNKRRRKH